MKPAARVTPLRREEEEPPERIAERRAADLARMARFIGDLQEKNFYGKITITVTSGRLTDLRVEQVMKIDELG